MKKITGDDGEDVEHVISKAFKRVHVLFQPISSCNISNVNALNYFKISDIIRERGKFDNRSYQGIEMNEACQLYLGNYSHIDSIDHLIKKIRMKYRCWKYWYSPMIHTMYLALVVAYGI